VIELTDEMRSRLRTALEDGCPVIAASVDREGQPKLTFYGSTHVHSNDQLAIWVRNPESGVLSRLAANPRMAFLYRHPADRVRWQFYGRAKVVDDPDVRTAVYAAIPEIERAMDPEAKGRAVLISVDRVTGRDLDMSRDE
jgi:hypothetical protein